MTVFCYNRPTMNNLPPLYRDDPSFTPQASFLSDEVYAQAMESFIIVCADTLPVNRAKKTVYLAKRKAKPQADWYLLGGRMQRGESEVEAAKRNIKRETGLEIATDRLEYIALKRYWWKERQQEPQNMGADTLIFTFALELTQDELAYASAQLDESEYETELGLREFSLEELKQANVHRSVIDLWGEIFK
jgi:ADP-ribose pyrophosphatase YjhB (NUDIX family)